MSRKTIACPECGKQFLKRLGSESITWARSKTTNCVIRIFSAECTEHGMFWDANDPGNHLTTLEAEFKTKFPKAMRNVIKDKLQPEERRLLLRMLDGEHHPDWKRLEQWCKLAAAE